MIGYTPAEMDIREQQGEPRATGADDPDIRHDGSSEPEGGTR